MSNGIGRVWAVNAEGGDEGRPNGVGPVWIENADQLGSKLPEPEAGDTGKVLGVLNADGDIGWVPDQEGMAQVQADWDQTDSSQVSYIANKPSLATVATTGAYSDLSNKPTIPSGAQLVPAATSADADKVLTVDSLGVPGWAVIPAQPTGLFEAVYGTTTFADIAQAVTDKRIVYCKVDQGYGQARMAFLAYVSNVAAEFQYYRSISSHSASTQTDEIYIYKVNADGWTTTTRKAGVNVTAGTHMSQSYNNDTLTLNCTWPTVDQTYSASSTNAQSGTAVAGAISGVRQVPSASSGDNGKVLGVTDSSGTLGWVAKDEADLFYVTYNVTTFDEIKAAHDAGKWPVLVDSNGRVAPMVDYNWVGGASSVQNAKFQVSEYDYTADTNGADYYNTVYNLELDIDAYLERTETWSTTSNNASADWDAVSGPRVIRNKPTIPTVDQTYNSASANAQSGVAVAQAIAAIPAVSYTAGDGIDITANEVAVKAGTGLEISDTTSTTESSLYETSDSNKYVMGFAPLTAGLLQSIQSNSGLTITTKISYNALPGNPSLYFCCLFSLTGGNERYFDKYLKLKNHTSAALQAGSVLTFNISDLDTSGSNTTIEYVQSHLGEFHLGLMAQAFGSWSTPVYLAGSSYSAVETATYPATVTITDALCVSNPLPASTSSDAGKLLTVNAQGTPAWGMLGSVTSIQQVNALPASPDANTLYLIPEA